MRSRKWRCGTCVWLQGDGQWRSDEWWRGFFVCMTWQRSEASGVWCAWCRCAVLWCAVLWWASWAVRGRLCYATGESFLLLINIKLGLDSVWLSVRCVGKKTDASEVKENGKFSLMCPPWRFSHWRQYVFLYKFYFDTAVFLRIFFLTILPFLLWYMYRLRRSLTLPWEKYSVFLYKFYFDTPLFFSLSVLTILPFILRYMYRLRLLTHRQQVSATGVGHYNSCLSCYEM